MRNERGLRASYKVMSWLGRLALPLALACVLVLIGLWIAEQVRLTREERAAADATAQSGAGSTAALQQPLQVLRLPPDVRPDTVSLSPDGALAVVSTAWQTSTATGDPNAKGGVAPIALTASSRLLLLRLHPDPGAVEIPTDVVTSFADLSFSGWLPNGTGFVARGTAPLPPTGTKAQLKTYGVSIVSPTGARRQLGVAQGGQLQISEDGAWIAGFDGDDHVIAIPTAGGDTRTFAQARSGALGALGWDGQRRIVVASYAAPFALQRVALDGTVTTTPLAGIRGLANARWSPDHRAALITASDDRGERTRVLTDVLTDLPAGALDTWAGPHELLARGSDGLLGTVDVLTGARRQLRAKMLTPTPRILASSDGFTIWMDDDAKRPHLTDVARDRDTTLGLNPPPERAQPLAGGRFVIGRGGEVDLFDSAAWWRQVPPTPSPLPVSRASPGYVRVQDDAGGWSVEIPEHWYQVPAPQHGFEVRSYDPTGMDYSGNFPPPGGVFVRMQMEQNPNKLDPSGFFQPPQTPGYQIRDHQQVTIAGQPAEMWSIWQSQPADWGKLEPTLYWYVRSPYFDDRMVVIHAVPAASPLRAEVERIVASLRFSPPTPVVLKPLVSRQQAIEQATAIDHNLGATITRVEAKLVLYKEWERASASGRSFATDPDMLVWVVVRAGRGLYCGMGGPLGASTRECHVSFSVLPARPPDQVGVFGTMPAWPAWFDQLTDLDPN